MDVQTIGQKTITIYTHRQHHRHQTSCIRTITKMDGNQFLHLFLGILGPAYDIYKKFLPVIITSVDHPPECSSWWFQAFNQNAARISIMYTMKVFRLIHRLIQISFSAGILMLRVFLLSLSPAYIKQPQVQDKRYTTDVVIRRVSLIHVLMPYTL